MKNLIIAFSLITLSACAANPAFVKSTSQNYRPKGEGNTLKIDSTIAVKQNLLDKDYAVTFYINENLNLFFQLDKSGNGSLSCESVKGTTQAPTFFYCSPHNGHKIGANCIGSTVNGNLSTTQCAFTYDDEIAANFRF